MSSAVMSYFDQITSASRAHNLKSYAAILGKIEILGPVYRLAGRGLSDIEIAGNPDI